jgi:hypothetical protein
VVAGQRCADRMSGLGALFRDETDAVGEGKKASTVVGDGGGEIALKFQCARR